MKKTATKSLLLAACLGVIAFQSFGQNKAKRFAFGANVGITEYAGDVQFGFYSFHNPTLTGGITLDYYMNKSFNGQITGSFGKFSGETADRPINQFETFYINSGFNIKYKFNNGYILKEDSKIHPYIWTGVNYLDYKAKNTSGLLNNPGDVYPDATKEAAFSIPYGIGLGFQISPLWEVHVQSAYTKPSSDEIDNHNVIKPEGVNDRNDRLLMHQIGVSYTFGGKDSDNDGVVDRYDRCPTIAGGEKTFGCPDADDDGVLDADDKCPNVKGVVFGCPDSDGDGVIDAEDKCPDVAGSLHGCLDSDGDGVADADDACPEEKGCINGCPDMDGDGVIDSQDQCPEVFGAKENKGCPTVIEEQPVAAATNNTTTKSPATPLGTRVEREKAHQSTTVYMVFFDYNSSVLNPEIQAELEQIASILAGSKEYYVILEGHTDSKGSDKYNEWLSGRRVDKVAEYLGGKGISKDRVLFVKYGESQPLLPNDTATGMEKNRRVVMKVVKN